MPEQRAIAVDLAALTGEDGKFRTMLAWGDPVTVLDQDSKRLKVEVLGYATQANGSIVAKKGFGYVKRRFGSGKDAQEVALPADEVKVLKVDFVDVQQGDGALIETPGGKTITLDGGDNQLFARYLAARYRGSSDAQRKEIDAMIVSHGDADHFAGLAEIQESETNSNPLKRLYAHPSRVYHNGLVKRPSSVPDQEAFGATKTVGKETIITGLETDLTTVADSEMNTYFRRWKKALKAWQESGPIEFRSLVKGDEQAFDFLDDEQIKVEVLGPIPVALGGEAGLRFLGKEPEGLAVDATEEIPDSAFTGLDAAHTINGQSVVLRLGFGNWRMLFAGDLNTQSEQTLTKEHKAGRLDLGAGVLKVPHHGSAEFSDSFLKAVEPLVSVVSSGDESARKEYIHPRATLMSALGRNGRGASSVIFVTELVAFFKKVGWVVPDAEKGVEGKAPKADEKDFFAFSRTAYGLVRVRTDGKRLLVYTNSGQSRMKEAYAYTATKSGKVTPAEVRKA